MPSFVNGKDKRASVMIKLFLFFFSMMTEEEIGRFFDNLRERVIYITRNYDNYS